MRLHVLFVAAMAASACGTTNAAEPFELTLHAGITELNGTRASFTNAEQAVTVEEDNHAAETLGVSMGWTFGTSGVGMEAGYRFARGGEIRRTTQVQGCSDCAAGETRTILDRARYDIHALQGYLRWRTSGTLRMSVKAGVSWNHIDYDGQPGLPVRAGPLWPSRDSSLEFSSSIDIELDEHWAVELSRSGDADYLGIAYTF